MKTDKFNNMISAFTCDFILAKDGDFKLAELDTNINKGNKPLLEDIELLRELDFLLRSGQAEIHIVK